MADRVPSEHPALGVTRLLVCAGGAIGLGLAGLVPPLYVLGALVAIAVPTHAGRLASFLKGSKHE